MPEPFRLCRTPARLLGAVGVAALLALAAPGVRAQDGLALPETTRLRLSGFATVGAAYSDMAPSWAFRRDVLQRGGHHGGVRKTVDSRLGLQANLALADDWEVVVQGVLKPLADNAPDEQRLEWAFLSYRPTPGWVARVGRVSTDTYLASQYSSVGFAYPWVRPNMEFYGWTSLQAIDGMDLVHNWGGGDDRWRAKLVMGEADLAVPTAPGERLTFRGRNMFGLSLARETGGLQVKLSYLQMNLSFSSSNQAQVDGLIAGLRGVQASPFLPPRIREEARVLVEGLPAGSIPSRYGALSVQYESGPWLTQAEFSRSSSNESGPNAQHYTASVAYRQGSVTWFGTTGRARPKHGPTVAPQWPLSLQPLGIAGAALDNLSRIEQRSVGAGLRWDFHEQMAFKVQLDRFKVGRNGGALWFNTTPEPRRANVLSIVVDTVF